MVIDSSALLAIFQREPERQAFLTAIGGANFRLISTASVVETSMVVLSRSQEDGLQMLQALMDDLRIDPVGVSIDHVAFAIDAFRRFGKGRHPAGLNLGDGFAYALAKATGEPLLFKGGDFALTDIKRAM